MMDDKDGWTVVSHTDKKGVLRRKGRKRTPQPKLSTPLVGELSRSPLSDDALFTCLMDCRGYIKSHTTLWPEIVDRLDQTFLPESESVKEIVCLGLGNFSLTGESYSEAPLFQLALAVSLQGHFPSSSLIAFDPNSLHEEGCFLRDRLHCAVLSDNDEGKYKATGNTIFFLPHCPRGLYENLIRSNWQTPYTLVLIGNSLTELADRNTNNSGILCAVHQLVAHRSVLLQEWPVLPLPKSECKQAPGNLLGAFNDTAVHCIRADKGDWPELHEGSSNDEDDPEVIRSNDGKSTEIC